MDNNLALPIPESFDKSSSMWVDEAIWGHRLHDEQSPWMIYLEFLNVFTYEKEKHRAFEEQNGFNTLKYRAAHRLYLRNLLFNNPFLNEIRLVFSHENDRWGEWIKRMTKAASARGLVQPDFTYLRNHFHSFDDFCETVSLIRSSSLEVETNKRWTSKFVFPYGPNCLYEDLDNNASTNDRRFFGRTGELLYLMLSRATEKENLRELLKTRLSSNDNMWNTIIARFQPQSDNELGSDRANCFLPYMRHSCFDDLAMDWQAILQLNLAGYDFIPHLVTLSGFHILKYQLLISISQLEDSRPFSFVCEVVAPKKTLVREISSDLYQENNLLPVRAIERFIEAIENSSEWRVALNQSDSLEACRKVLKDKVLWGDNYEGHSDPRKLMADFRQAAIKRHRQHVANIHRNYGRNVGLVSKRGTNKLRYAPTDSFLKSLLFANVIKRMEFKLFLAKLYERYGLVFGDAEAARVLSKGDFDKKPFQANSRRLEERLGSLGLLKRLSDGCAYVTNPYS